MQTAKLDATKATLADPEFIGIGGMREAYNLVDAYPTSTNGDIFLIRSHIGYHAGFSHAKEAEIKPSRGHSYRFELHGQKHIVRIVDHYDHRNGVQGFIN